MNLTKSRTVDLIHLAFSLAAIFSLCLMFLGMR